MRWFSRHTAGKPVIMGRKTFDSMPAPLARRRNMVISRNIEFSPAGAEVFDSLEAAYRALDDEDEPMVIGASGGYGLASRCRRVASMSRDGRPNSSSEETGIPSKLSNSVFQVQVPCARPQVYRQLRRIFAKPRSRYEMGGEGTADGGAPSVARQEESSTGQFAWQTKSNRNPAAIRLGERECLGDTGSSAPPQGSAR